MLTVCLSISCIHNVVLISREKIKFQRGYEGCLFHVVISFQFNHFFWRSWGSKYIVLTDILFGGIKPNFSILMEA